MDARLAESLVRKWQVIKSQALGPSHCLEKLPEVSFLSFSWMYFFRLLGQYCGVDDNTRC